MAAIYRKGQLVVPDGDTVIAEDDTVFFLAARRYIEAMMKELRPLDSPLRRVILAGGGHIGSALAQQLERDHHVKVIERDPERAEAIAEELEKAIVLIGDVADENLLREEAIETTDVFCALTNDDEANILASMLAKRLGARKVLAIINRPAYVDLVEIRRNRRGRITRADHHWRPAVAYPARQHRSCALAAPRGSRSHRGPGAGRQAFLQGGGARRWKTSPCRRAPPSAPSCVARK